jgi:hypothetical protein
MNARHGLMLLMGRGPWNGATVISAEPPLKSTQSRGKEDALPSGMMSMYIIVGDEDNVLHVSSTSSVDTGEAGADKPGERDPKRRSEYCERLETVEPELTTGDNSFWTIDKSAFSDNMPTRLGDSYVFFLPRMCL